MAKRKKNAKKLEKSKSWKELCVHDEHKLLLFVIGLVFGIALTSLGFGVYVYVGLAALAIAVVLSMIEIRERQLQ